MRQHIAVPIGELLSDALRNVWQGKERTALALLGIVVGTASIVAMLCIGSMAERETLKQFEGMGVNVFYVRANGVAVGAATGATSPSQHPAAGFEVNVIDKLPDAVPGIARVSALRTGFVHSGGRPPADHFPIAATTPSIREIAHLKVCAGRFMSPIDDGNLVAVLGADAAQKLAATGHPVEIGQQIRLDNYYFTIIGVLEAVPSTSFLPFDLNGSVFIPLGTASRLLGPSSADGAIGIMKPGADATALGSAVSTAIVAHGHGGSVQVQSAQQLIGAFDSQRAMQSRLFVGLASISLLVGGIGVMNVMLMSVLERRREIGLRSAVGAGPLDIQLAFLAEAAALSVLGGLVGDVLGVFIGLITAQRSGWSFHIPVFAVPIGACVAGIVGVASGVYPALRASAVDPITALRTE